MDFVATLNHTLEQINSVLWHDAVLYVVLGTGILFTIWSCFGQYRALTHGVAVTRGKYDDHDDPGAINHFQALSAALSATVGLGNIGGVAVAIALGGPGAVFWMWVIGLFGMAIKMAEVTLSMLYRNTDDRDNPHGGPMWVVSKGLAERGMPTLGKFLGGLFCITLLISATTGGNMFQSWNVAGVTRAYFDIPEIVTGIALAVVVAAVIIGGIKRIGAVAGRIVPFMCVAYLLAALYVVFMRFGDVPGVFKLIVNSAFTGTEASDAFIGGTFGYAFLWGMKRALFSSEAGQGSSPIAHSAAKTDEPVREGIVAGLEPFIDTLVVCTLTSLVILLSGTWDRGAVAELSPTPQWVEVKAETPSDPSTWRLDPTPLPKSNEDAWRAGDSVFLIVEAGKNEDAGNNLHRVEGTIREVGTASGSSGSGSSSPAAAPVRSTNPPGTLEIEWSTTFEEIPKVTRPLLYQNWAGATLTAKSFDAINDGLGKWLVTFAAWLFAISTIISWSYYGEQGIVYLFGNGAVLIYKLVYCALTMIATLGFIRTDTELDNLTTLGTGVMLVVNIPITLLFGAVAMKAYHDYIGRLKAGKMAVDHEHPDLNDVMEGREPD